MITLSSDYSIADPISPEHERVREAVYGIVAADNVGNVDQVLRYYAEDAVLITPDGTDIVGTEAIRRHYEALFAGADFVIEPRIDEILLESRLAIVRGINSIRSKHTATDTVTCITSRYLMSLRMQPDGRWQIRHLMWANQESRCEPKQSTQGLLVMPRRYRL